MNVGDAAEIGSSTFGRSHKCAAIDKSDRQMTDGIATQLLYFLLSSSHVVEDCRRSPDEGLTKRRR